MRWGARLLALAAAAALTGCAPKHQFTRMENGDHSLVATLDYIPATFGMTHDAAVSVQERQGLAASVAFFRNITHIEVDWLGPEDLNICQSGTIIGYKTAVDLNTSKGKRTVHVHYSCS